MKRILAAGAALGLASLGPAAAEPSLKDVAARTELRAIQTLACALDVPVEFSDERLTTVVATQQLRERGVKGRKQRAVVDQAAAVAILQTWLDAERSAEGRS